MMRGVVTAHDSLGLYVQTAETGIVGPLPWIGGNPPADGASVLVADAGNPGQPDLIVLGAVPGSAALTTVDNTVPRFNGTAGALQTSGVVIGDDNKITAVGSAAGYIIVANAGSGNASAVEFHTGDGSSTASRRWWTGKGAAAETGGNAGSDYQVWAYDDSGSSLGAGLVVTRSTRRVTLGSVGATAGLEFGTGGPRIMAGAGSPEGAVTAPIGSLWLRTNGGANTTLYVKESGTGSTGWVAK